jgi:hypothetical protein
MISQGSANVSDRPLQDGHGRFSIVSLFRLGNGKLSYSNGITGVSTSGPPVSAGEAGTSSRCTS